MNALKQLAIYSALLMSACTPTHLAVKSPDNPKESLVDPDTASPLITKIRSASVVVNVFKDQKEGQGSGSILRFREGKQIVVLTARHVVFEEDGTLPDITFMYADISGRYMVRVEAMLAAESEANDLAIIVSTEPARYDGPEVSVSSSTPRIGEEVYLVSSYAFLERSVTRGIVANLFFDEQGEKMIRIDAAGFFGSSGGGIFNTNGEIVGIAQSLGVIPMLGVIPGTLQGYTVPSLLFFLYSNHIL